MGLCWMKSNAASDASEVLFSRVLLVEEGPLFQGPLWQYGILVSNWDHCALSRAINRF